MRVNKTHKETHKERLTLTLKVKNKQVGKTKSMLQNNPRKKKRKNSHRKQNKEKNYNKKRKIETLITYTTGWRQYLLLPH